MNDKRVLRGEETYERILQSSLYIISREGLSGLTASRLSREAGISKSSLFHHFDSIKDIPLAVFAMIEKIMLKPLEDNSINTIDGIFNAFEHSLFSDDEKTQIIGKAFVALYCEGLYKREYFERFKSFQSITVTKIAAMFMTADNPGLSEEMSLKIAKLLIASLDGLSLHSMLEEERDAYISCWKLQKQLILDYIEKGTAK